MTALIVFKSLAVLQLLLTLDPSRQLAHAAASTPSPVTRAGFQFVTARGDYDDDYDGDYPDQLSRPRSAAPPAGPDAAAPELCRYDPCLEDQPPCAALAAQSGCLCPGLSGASQPPRAPRLQGLLPPGDGDPSRGPVVRWCAPSSVVTGYRVVVDGDRGAALEFPGALGRRGQVGGVLEAGAEVCVEAVNGAGHSAASSLSCARYQPPPGGLSGAVTLGLLVGGVALLLLLVVMALALHMRRRARRKNTEAGAEGLGNPSYSASAEGQL